MEPAWQQPYLATSAPYQTRNEMDPYTVHGFASTTGSVGSRNAGPPAVSAPEGTHISGTLPDRASYNGPAVGSVYGSSSGAASVVGTARQSPAPPSPPLVLTHPSTGVSNEGWDNENSDLIITVGDVYESSSKRWAADLYSLAQNVPRGSVR